MEFEFDPAKSASNQEKHGVDFVQAQQLWQDPMRIEVPARHHGRAAVAGHRADGRQALVGRGDLQGRQGLRYHLRPPGTG